MKEDRNGRVETPKTEFEKKVDKVTSTLLGRKGFLQTIDILLNKDVMNSSAKRRDCIVWNGYTSLLLK